MEELKNINGKFGDRIAIERALKYRIGHSYEWLAEKVLIDKDPKERADMFEKAALWYQAADEAVGFWTDYALRQSEACAGAAHYRIEAGINDEMTQWFANRRHQLLNAVFGDNVILMQGDMPAQFKMQATGKIEDVVTAYFFRNHPIDPELN